MERLHRIIEASRILRKIEGLEGPWEDADEALRDFDMKSWDSAAEEKAAVEMLVMGKALFHAGELALVMGIELNSASFGEDRGLIGELLLKHAYELQNLMATLTYGAMPLEARAKVDAVLGSEPND